MSLQLNDEKKNIRKVTLDILCEIIILEMWHQTFFVSAWKYSMVFTHWAQILGRTSRCMPKPAHSLLDIKICRHKRGRTLAWLVQFNRSWTELRQRDKDWNKWKFTVSTLPVTPDSKQPWVHVLLLSPFFSLNLQVRGVWVCSCLDNTHGMVVWISSCPWQREKKRKKASSRTFSDLEGNYCSSVERKTLMFFSCKRHQTPLMVLK